MEIQLSQKPQIIDVRETHEFRNGHIPGAKNVPLKKVNQYTPNSKTYVICQSGMRSKKATKMLLKQGYDVINVRGGMLSWSGTKKEEKINEDCDYRRSSWRNVCCHTFKTFE
ncbi:rhodanese-like domain-containing protein [Desemzia sp. RIT 804]|uniref:rhodanese-like domain-containing protein n=1 Tax=Desemzia sp. RIT 804 TaxID=2810209 RepID=UPI001BB30D94